MWPSSNREYETPVFRYEYSSPVQPRSVYAFDVAAGTSTLVRRQPVPGYDPDSYVAKIVIQDNPDDERMLMGYQSMTVLARLIWGRPYDPKLAARLRRVQCPTLLLWGKEDRLVPPAYAEAFVRHDQNAGELI